MTIIANLQTLPLELVLAITSHLPPSSLISLSLASKHFRQRIPTVPKTTYHAFASSSKCEQLAIARYTWEHWLLRSKRRRCVLCSVVQATDFFNSEVSAICKWHDGWFMAMKAPPTLEQDIGFVLWGLQREARPYWVAVQRKFCVHEGEVLGWQRAGCRCRCESCGHLDVTCYVRVHGSDDWPKSWTLRTANRDGDAVVEEERVSSVRSGLGSPKTWSDFGAVRSVSLQAYHVEIPVVRIEDLLKAD